MNWSNIDLNSDYQASSNLLENYTFKTLLLEINCNVTDINKETVKAQAMEIIKAKYAEAIGVLEENLDNITNHAIKERAIE